jgi:hypothetical protein
MLILYVCWFYMFCIIVTLCCTCFSQTEFSLYSFYLPWNRCHHLLLEILATVQSLLNENIWFHTDSSARISSSHNKINFVLLFWVLLLFFIVHSVFRSSANPEFPSLVLDYRCVPLIRMFSVIKKFHVKWFGVCVL